MADRAKFLDFLDMIDGGGRGKMGGEFKGGGIISDIANLIATPYGSEDPVRRKQRQKALGLLDKIGTKEEQAAAASRAAATPSVVKRSVPEVTSSPRPQLRPAAPVGKTMDQAVGGAQYPSMYRSMDSVVGGMGVPAAPVGKTMDQAVGGAQYPSMYRSMDSVVGQIGAPNLPRPVATTAALSPTGSTVSGVAPVPPMSEQLAPMAPATPMMPAPSIPAGMNLPQDAAKSRAMAALRQRFPNATPEQLANAAAMMGM